MTNYVQDGHVLSLAAPTGGVTKDVPVQIGQLLVVPLSTAAETVSFAGVVRGVVTVTKVGSQGWAVGEPVYWDAGNTRFTSVAAGNRLAGCAVEIAGSGAGVVTGTILLDGAIRLDEAT